MGSTTPVAAAGTSEESTVLTSVETAPTTFERTPLSVADGRRPERTEEIRSPELSTSEVGADATSDRTVGTRLVTTETGAERIVEIKSPVLSMSEVGVGMMSETTTEAEAERMAEIESGISVP
jgi:hypothetical protein